MKYIILFLLAVAIALPSAVKSQPCPMPCSSQSFPYWFCTQPTGLKVLKCSTDPNSEDPHLRKAAKTRFPACVNVVPIDGDFQIQPSSGVPNAPEMPQEPSRDEYWAVNKQTPGDYNPNFPTVDAWQDAWEQYVEDSTNFIAGLPLEIDSTLTENPDDSAAVYVFGGQDSSVTYGYYAGPYATYQDELYTYDTASASHAAGTDVSYTQVWKDGDANSDGLLGLHAWLGICGIHGDATCPCILVKPDNNAANWPGNYEGQGVHYAVGKTYGHPDCPDGQCPDAQYRYITYNTSNRFLYRNNAGVVVTHPDYILHPSAPAMSWYTESTAPLAYPGYHAFSFREVVEHEIGHFLGMSHPDDVPSDSVKCTNNFTHCRGSISNYWMLMGSAQAGPDIDARGLGTDDICMFKKLYCPEQLSVGPQQPAEPEVPSPSIYPNPSHGGMTLTYTVASPCFVQVIIYDVLGNIVRTSYSSYEEPGTRSITLGTESLPAGHYVCRATIGGKASYINLLITK